MTQDKPIRVLIVDDYEFVRIGLDFFLSTVPDIRVIGQANDGDRALAMCATFQPDVVLMDLVMPRVNGLDATRTIRSQFPKIQVIILTSFQEHDMVQLALKAGAIGYVLKDIPPQELAEAIRAAAVGKSTFSPDILEVLVQCTTQQSDHPNHNLSKRELEVLLHLVEGLQNHEIAEKFVVSINTIRHHVHGILSKLGVANRTAAVRVAIHEKLVPTKTENSEVTFAIHGPVW